MYSLDSLQLNRAQRKLNKHSVKFCLKVECCTCFTLLWPEAHGGDVVANVLIMELASYPTWSTDRAWGVWYRARRHSCAHRPSCGCQTPRCPCHQPAEARGMRPCLTPASSLPLLPKCPSPLQARFYELLQGPGSGVCGVFWHGETGDGRYALVLELHGASLEDAARACNGTFSSVTTLMLAQTLMRRFEYIHSRGISACTHAHAMYERSMSATVSHWQVLACPSVHRDVKPQNFLIRFPESMAGVMTAYAAEKTETSRQRLVPPCSCTVSTGRCKLGSTSCDSHGSSRSSSSPGSASAASPPSDSSFDASLVVIDFGLARAFYTKEAHVRFKKHQGK